MRKLLTLSVLSLLVISTLAACGIADNDCVEVVVTNYDECVEAGGVSTKNIPATCIFEDEQFEQALEDTMDISEEDLEAMVNEAIENAEDVSDAAVVIESSEDVSDAAVVIESSEDVVELADVEETATTTE